jgi:hypothetical protein
MHSKVLGRGLTKIVLAENDGSDYYPINNPRERFTNWLQNEYRRDNQELSAAKRHVTR